MDADAQIYGPDFNVAKDLKESVLRALSDKSSEPLASDAKKPISSRHVLPDGRKVVIYFPHGSDHMKNVLRKARSCECTGTSQQELSPREDSPPKDCIQLYFVLFVGFKKDFSTAQGLIEPSWQLDNGLKKDMVDIEEILSYSSCERTAGGDWTNMVIFTSLGVLEKWRESSLHTAAVRDFSPTFYSKVRIHRGQIDGDFKDGGFHLHKTLFLDYGQANSIPERKEKNWNTSEPPQHYNPVVFKC